MPQNLDWRLSGLETRLPASEWARMGVQPRYGSLPGDLPASLVLPMGRNGPAFLAYPNFHVFLEWNESLVYWTTVANFATRLAVSDACVKAGVPLLSAAVGRFQGQVGAFAGHLAEQACYRCFVGDAFDAEDCDTCAEDGMLGAMAGWVGSFAALHAVRVLLKDVSGFGDPQWSRVNLLDGMQPGMRQFTIAKDPACKGCGSGI